MSLQVGQKVWLKSINSIKRTPIDNELCEVEISKIGTKYFFLTEERYGRFFIDTLNQDNGEYNSRYRIYLSKEKHDNEVESTDLIFKLHDFFYRERGLGKSKFPLEKLREIHKIINS